MQCIWNELELRWDDGFAAQRQFRTRFGYGNDHMLTAMIEITDAYGTQLVVTPDYWAYRQHAVRQNL